MPTALILSLGTLNQSVNTDAFIGKLTKKAEEQNPGFKLTRELVQECLKLSDTFNRNEVEKESYRQQLTQKLGVTISPEEFWGWWKEIVTVGPQIRQTMEELNSFSSKSNSLVYFNSDTNVVHLEQLQMEYGKNGVSFRIDSKPAAVANFPVFASCQYGKSRFELVQDMVAAIKAKQFNSPERIVLLTGDPENIKNEMARNAELAKLAKITAWCKEQGVDVVLHNNSRTLVQTLEQAVPARVAEHSLGMNKLSA